jgi:CheY-like chemotaxis protein
MEKSHGNPPEGVSELRDNVPDSCQMDDSCRTGSLGAPFKEEGARCHKRPWPELPPAQLDALTEVSGRTMADERPAGMNPTDPEEQEKSTKRRRVAGENLAAVTGNIFVEEPNYPLTSSRKSDCPVEPSGCGLVHLAEGSKQREVEEERLHGVQRERSHGVQGERSHGVQGERSHGVQGEQPHGVLGEHLHEAQGEHLHEAQGGHIREAQGKHVHGGQRLHLHEQCEPEGKSAEGGEEQRREKWMRVLAVDDSPTDRRLVERLLRQRHYEGEAVTVLFCCRTFVFADVALCLSPAFAS